MAGRARSTFGKRQKEMKRLEKRREKEARKEQRKQEKSGGPEIDFNFDPWAGLPPEPGSDEEEAAQPVGSQENKEA